MELLNQRKSKAGPVNKMKKRIKSGYVLQGNNKCNWMIYDPERRKFGDKCDFQTYYDESLLSSFA